jgi:hypothetical protein
MITSKSFIHLGLVLSISAAALPLTASAVELDDFSCTKGQYRLLIPKTYSGLLKLGKVRTFADGNVPAPSGEAVRHRLIEFDGLSLWIVRRSDLVEGYRVSYAVISSPKWKLLPFRVGQSPPPSTKGLLEAGLIPATGQWQLEGDTDVLQINMQGGLVKSLTLDCATD